MTIVAKADKNKALKNIRKYSKLDIDYIYYYNDDGSFKEKTN
jgi:hypothetical protein